MTIFILILVTLVMGVATAIHGAVGFGIALMANPILVLINPDFVPAPMLTNTLVISVLVMLRERKSIDLGGLRWGIVGRVLGAILAAWLIVRIPQDGMVSVFGVLVLVAVLMSVIGLRLEIKPSNLVLAGILAGLMGTIASIGGPPMALLYQDEAGARFRSTLSGFFIIGICFSLVTLALIGHFDLEDVWLGLALLPGSLLGYQVSSRALGWVSPTTLRRAVWIISSASAVVVIIRQLI